MHDSRGQGSRLASRKDGSLGDQSGFNEYQGVCVAIYRTLYYGDVTVGTGGRLTIPLGIRSDCGIRKGDTLTVRVEETPKGTRQLVMWRTERSDEE